MLSRRVTFLLTAAALAGCGPSPTSAPSDGAKPAPAAAAAAKPAEPPKPAPADPMKDAAAWKALPSAERAAKAADVVAKADAATPSEVERVRAFLTERGETAAALALAKKAHAAGSTAAWVREAAGEVNLVPEVDACLAAADAAEDAEDLSFLKLKAERAKTGGVWWAGPEEAQRVRALVESVKKAQALLVTPYGEGINRWARYQRAIPVMKDSPAIHAARGPYLVFVSLDTGDDVAKRAKTVADVPPADLARAEKILAKNLELFADFYEGFLREYGSIFGVTRYGPENADFKTLFKVNVFSTAREYKRYADHDSPMASSFARAYYSPEEPRFVTTYDGGDDESEYETDQTQCHEATHQLVHFYTWELSSKALGREIGWLDCHVRPLWSNEGVAEFFSAFAMKDGKRVWMQPLVSRIRDLWLLGGIAEEKKWRPWDIKEFMSMRNAGQLQSSSESRGKPGEDGDLVGSVMANLYYARAWSLFHFLWYAEQGGKPKYRDKFVQYLKHEFHVTIKLDKIKNVHAPVPVGVLDFRRIFGLEKDDAFFALDREWQDYEKALVAAHKTPEWDMARARARKSLGIDK